MATRRLSVSCDDSVASAVEGDSSHPEPVDDERKTLARKEDKAVRYLRWVVLVLLVLTATVVSTGCLLFMKASQNEAFVDEYEMFATKIINSFQQTVFLKVEAMEALSVSFTSYALGTGASFPNVTLPDFEIRGTNTRILADAEIITYSPLVTDENRDQWEEYVTTNLAHFDETIVDQSAAQDGYFNDTNTEHQNKAYEIHDRIFDTSPDGSIVDAAIDSGPYLPVWLSTPMHLTKGLLNLNMLSLPAARAYRAVLGTGESVVDLVENLTGEYLGETSANLKLTLSTIQYRKDLGPMLLDPVSPFGYPVFDSFDTENREVVGLLATHIFWKLYLENIVTEKAQGILCVWKNTAGQAFTYRVDGAKAQFLGEGDLHESQFDGMMRSALFSSALETESKTSLERVSSTSVPLDLDYLDYTLFVYPSNVTKAVYTSNSPVIAFVVVACAFFFTSMVFISYDCFVARRQRIVMNRAIASSAIVSSLFPAQVRDQVYEEREEQERKRLSNQFSCDGKANAFSGDDVEANRKSRPIAEKFEHTTILFADLAGFTKWSSTRRPEEVFELLETLYSAFDEIALRRKVFKVETVGDCYVAATGVPNPQPDHAVIMCRFAQECMESMVSLLAGLADSLGADTLSLAMRVGMHSGPITGGVLRGAKSRFQLFGDTINTASRMESNGVRGRIHVSQQTADELIARGKREWILPREEKIVAKGKGELQTYFVNPAYRDGQFTSM